MLHLIAFLFPRILVVDDFSTTQNLFFIIFLMVIYLHGLYLASFFLGYAYASNYSTNQKIKNVWKIIVTYFIYEGVLYLALKAAGLNFPQGWPYYNEIAHGVVVMTGIEFLFLNVVGIFISFKLKVIQKLDQSPYEIEP